MQVVEETLLPGSLGMLYMMMTAYLGFRPLDGEYKVMGLASYGEPKTYAKEFADLFEQQPDGSCLTTKLVRADFGEYIEELFGPARASGGPVTRREMDIAAALQKGFEDAMLLRMAYLKDKYAIKRICLAGGAALNVVMTGKLARSGMFKQTYVFPAAGDDGASVGAAQYVYHDSFAPAAARRTAAHHEPRSGVRPRSGCARLLKTTRASSSFHQIDNVEDAVADALVER